MIEDFDFSAFSEEDDASEISFFYEDIDESIIDENKIIEWLTLLTQEEKVTIGAINYIFCNDVYLLELNQNYLDHDTLTDIITFQYDNHPEPISGDIYISVERTQDNAASIGTHPDEELRRVIAHGLLHLCGYKDKTEEEEKTMRSKENYYLEKFSTIV